MSLKFHFHPLSSFCHKALIGLYETGVAFEPVLVNLGEAASRAAFLKIWPGGKFPVLQDGDRIIPESSIIIEYLAQHYPGKSQLIPADPDLARQARLRDRFFDFFVHLPMQKIVGDRLRPADQRDPFGVEEARQRLRASYDMLENEAVGETGKDFTLADCAAAPALFYANMQEPFGDRHGKVAAYLERLKQRPSYARVLKEAEPYFGMIPK